MALKIEDLDTVFQELELSHPSFSDTPYVAFLDRGTGDVVKPSNDSELDDCLANPEMITFPKTFGSSLDRYALVLDFIDTIEDGGLRITLDRLVKKRGAMRRFKDFIYIEAPEPIKHAWEHFETNHRRNQIADWLDSIELEYE